LTNVTGGFPAAEIHVSFVAEEQPISRIPAMACNPTAAYDDALVAIARKGAP
jgi:hypothetical protein